MNTTRIWNSHDLSDEAYRAVLDAGDSAKISEFEALRAAYDKENLEHWKPDPAKYPALSQDDLSMFEKLIGDATSEAFDQRIGHHVENVPFLEEAIYDHANDIVAAKDAEIARLRGVLEMHGISLDADSKKQHTHNAFSCDVCHRDFDDIDDQCVCCCLCNDCCQCIDCSDCPDLMSDDES